MANDRVFLICEVCQDVVCLGKFSPSYALELKGDKFSQFIMEHNEKHLGDPAYHDGRPYIMTLGDTLKFSLLNEAQMSARGISIFDSDREALARHNVANNHQEA